MQPAAVLAVLVQARGVQATNAQLATVQGNLTKTGTAGSAMGASLARGAKVAALGAAGVTAASVKLAVDFDKSMRNVNSIAQLPEKSFKRLEGRVLKLAGPTAQAPRTLAEGLYDLVSSGFDADDSMKVLRSSARAATAGLTDTATSTKAVAAVLNSYQLGAGKASDVSDVLFRIVDRGVISFDQLSNNIGDVLPFASSLGVDLRQVGAAIATMTKAGISPAETMTRIKSVMQSMLKPSEALGKAVKGLGFESGEALIKQEGFQGALEKLAKTTGGSKEKLAALFPNVRALGGALALTGKNAAGAGMDLEGMAKASGSTTKALAEQAKSTAFQWGRLKVQAQVLGIQFGQRLLPEINKVLSVLSNPKLDGTEKIDRITKVLSDAVAKAVPMIAEQAARAAPKAVAAFFTAWRRSNLWGKLLIGGFLLKKMGGLGMFTVVGRQAGGAMAAGMATGAAAGAGAGAAAGGGAAAALLAKIAPRVRGAVKAGLGLAVVMGVADALLPAPKVVDERLAEIAGKIRGWRSSGKLALNRPGDPANSIIRKGDLDDFTGAERRMLSGMANLRNMANTTFAGAKLIPDAWSNPRKAMGDLNRLRDGLDVLRGRMGDLSTTTGDVKRIVGQNLSAIASTMGSKTSDARKAVTDNMAASSGAIVDNMKKGRTSVARGLPFIHKMFRVHSEAAAGTTQENFAVAKGAIRDAVAAGLFTSRRGLREIQRLWRAALSFYGVDNNNLVEGIRSGDVDGFTFPRLVPPSERPQRRRPTRPVGRQAGGIMVPGQGSGDKVRALLEPGEVVWNREAVRGMGGPREANRVNEIIPRFAAGGTIPKLKVAGPDSALRQVVQGSLDTASSAASASAKKLIAALAAASGGGGGGGGSKGPDGIGTYRGVTLAKWVIEALRFAARKGVNPQPTSGYRSHATNVAAGRNYVSQHEGTKYPHGAVDYGSYTTGLAAKMSVVGATQGFKYPLLAPIGFADDGHASGTGHQAGGVVAGLNRKYPATSLRSPGAQLTSTQVRGVAEKWGGLTPPRALQAAQVARGESNFHPGIIGRDPGGTLGIGLWQITRGVQGALGRKWIDSRGGDAGMRNPRRNAEVMALLSGKGGDWSNWYGTSFLKPVRSKVRSVLGAAGRLPGATGPTKGERKRTRRQASAQAKRLRRQVRAIRGIGLSGKMEGRLRGLSGDAAKFEEFASRAGQLTDRSGEEDVPGEVFGRDESAWLREQLGALLKLRNATIRARAQIQHKRAAVGARIEAARERLVRTRKQLKVLRGRLKELRRYPRRNRAKIQAHRAKIGRLSRAATGLKEKVLPALRDRRRGLTTRRGELTGSLEDIQGVGSSEKVLRSLPPVGGLGGDIFSAQVRLRDLGQKPAAVTDSTATSGATDTSELLRDALRLANRRTAVSEAGFGVLRDLGRSAQFAGTFHTGGIVPGPAGRERTAKVRAGEGVFTAGQMAAMGPSAVTVVVNGDIVGTPAGVDPVEVVLGDRRFPAAVEKATRPAARRAGRKLPSRGGG